MKLNNTKLIFQASKLQLDELDTQLIKTLDELKKTSKKLMLSPVKLRFWRMKLNLIQQKHDDLESRLTQSDATISTEREGN